MLRDRPLGGSQHEQHHRRERRAGLAPGDAMLPKAIAEGHDAITDGLRIQSFPQEHRGHHVPHLGAQRAGPSRALPQQLGRILQARGVHVGPGAAQCQGGEADGTEVRRPALVAA